MTDAEINFLLVPIVPPDAHPTTLARAIAFYREIEGRPPEEIAVLLALQQVTIEGMNQNLTRIVRDEVAKEAAKQEARIVRPRRNGGFTHN